MKKFVKPKKLCTLRIKQNMEVYLRLNPRQKWKIFETNNAFVGIERNNISIIISKDYFYEYFQ